MNSSKEIKISGFDRIGEVVYYTINCTFNEKNWELQKRYKEFSKLNKILKTNNGNIPEFPGKTMLPVKKDPEIEKRRLALENYLTALCQRNDIFANPAFVEFLELDKHRPEDRVNPLEARGCVSQMLMGFRDSYLTSDGEFLLCATSDTGSISRVDSYVTNLKMPWEKKDPNMVLLAVGHLECFQRKKTSDGKFEFKEAWKKKFKSQAICITFCESSRLLAVGCNDGSIHAVDLSGSQLDTRPETIDRFKLHGGRVMAISIDAKNKIIHSIGEDNYLRSLNFTSKSQSQSLYVSKHKLCDFFVDHKNQIAYCADRKGNLAVVTLKTEPYAVKQYFKSTGKGPIRSMQVDLEEGILFCSTYKDCSLHIFRLTNTTSPEARIEKLKTLFGSPNPRCIAYWKSRKEVWVGHKDGLVSVFSLNLNSSTSIYSFKHAKSNINSLQVVEDRAISLSSSDKCLYVLSPNLVLQPSLSLAQKPRL